MSIISKSSGNDKELSKRLSGFCKKFGVYNLLSRFGAEKTRGVSFREVFNFVFALVFSGRNLYNTEKASLSKDTIYRFLNNAKIHWEKNCFCLPYPSLRESVRSQMKND